MKSENKIGINVGMKEGGVKKMEKDYRGRWGCVTVFVVGEVVGVVWVLAQGGVCIDNVMVGLLQFGPMITLMIVLIIVLGWMFIHAITRNDSGKGSRGINIPAPSKQTMRMLRRNIRRRWF